MNLRFINRSRVQRSASVPFNGASIAVANPMGYGLDGCAATCQEVSNSNPAGVRESNRIASVLGGSLRAILTAVMILGTLVSFAQYSIKYTGSNPVSGSTVDSFENIELEFDLSEVVEGFEGIGEWGVFYTAFYNAKLPTKEKSATLYKGSLEDGEVIARLTTSYNERSEGAQAGNKLVLSFNDIEIEPNQEYTIKVTYDVRAVNLLDPTMYSQTIAYKDEPLVLTFFGGQNAAKVLLLESSDIQGSKIEKLNTAQLSFNYSVSISDDFCAELLEDGQVIASSHSVKLNEGDDKSICVTFPETECYVSHNYILRLPENSISILGENSYNSEISISFEGASYRTFGIGRVRPSNGSVSVMDEITVPFKFPTAEDKTYGFVNVDNGTKKWYIHIYEGNNGDGEELLTVEGNVGADSQSLIFHPDYKWKPETEYTFIIPEGEILAYEIGAPKETYLKDYISERVELHYTTPSVEELPLWIPSLINLKEDDEIAELKYVILDSPVYEYDQTVYNTVVSNTSAPDKDANLYLVTDNGDELITSFRMSRKNLNADSEIGNGELIGSYFVGELNETLYEGQTYKFVWNANSYRVKNAFIGQFIYNPEISVVLKGATPTINDFGLTANVDDRLHSHADVFSFVTESEVKAGEGAKMVLMDGEENVAEAPVYVSREANGHRVYADFGGKKLEAGKSYDVVLPEGSVYAANGIVNNPEIKSTINAMPEAPATPEFISIDLNIDEYASATYRMVKGEESVLDLKGGEDWKLESLMLNDKDVTANVEVNGLYTIPALEADATLCATYAYAHEIDFDYTVGVGEVPECPYGVCKDGSHVILSGLKGGDAISIFTVGGMKVTSLPVVPADMDEVSIALPEGQVYVILINNTSIKYRH